MRGVGILLVVALWASIASAQPNREGGETGTLNHDYFYPNHDAHTLWLFKDIEKNHLEPGLRAFSQGDMEKALIEMDYLLARIVNHPRGLALLGAIATTTKRPSLPVRYYERALRLYPQHALTHAQYGSYLTDIGNVDSGVAQLKQAVQINPQLTVGYVWLAKAYQKSGSEQLARAAADQARALGYRGTLE